MQYASESEEYTTGSRARWSFQKTPTLASSWRITAASKDNQGHNSHHCRDGPWQWSFDSWHRASGIEQFCAVIAWLMWLRRHNFIKYCLSWERVEIRMEAYCLSISHRVRTAGEDGIACKIFSTITRQNAVQYWVDAFPLSQCDPISLLGSFLDAP